MRLRTYVLTGAIIAGAAGGAVGAGVDYIFDLKESESVVAKRKVVLRQGPDSLLEGTLVGASIGLVFGALAGAARYSESNMRISMDDDYGPECHGHGPAGGCDCD